MERLFLLILALVLSVASADEYWSGFEVRCDTNEFRVTAYGSEKCEVAGNATSRQICRKSGEETVSCELGGHKLEAELRFVNGYKCGHGNRVTLKADGEVLLYNEEFHGCSKSLSSVTIKQGSGRVGGYNLELCGDTGSQFVPRFEGCILANSELHLSAMGKPLGHWGLAPLIELISSSDPVERLALVELFKRDGLEAVRKIDEQVSPTCESRRLLGLERALPPAPYSWRRLTIDRCGLETSYVVEARVYQYGSEREPHFTVIEPLMRREDYVRLLAARNGVACAQEFNVEARQASGGAEGYLVSCGKNEVSFECRWEEASKYVEDFSLRNTPVCWRI